MSNSKLVLVTGATGQQGGAVARALLNNGFRVRGTTRNMDSPAAQKLTALGAEVVRADFRDRSSLVKAAAEVDTVFGMSTSFEAGEDAEVRQGIALIDSAVQAGVDHFIYTSVASANQNTGIPHFESKYKVEKHLATTALDWTVVAPAAFMENLILPQGLEALRSGTYAIALPPEVHFKQTAVADIGQFGAHVVKNKDEFVGRRIDIGSDGQTSAEVAEILSDVLGRAITVQEVPISEIRAFNEDFAIMFEWFLTTGYDVDIEGLRARYPEVGWHRFADWARATVPAALGEPSALLTL